MRGMHEAPPPPDWSLLQKILNERWPPLRDRRGESAVRFIPEQPHWIDVNARLVWEKDGEEVINAKASRWINAYVFVTFSDPRRNGYGVWLRASDVTRRPGERA